MTRHPLFSPVLMIGSAMAIAALPRIAAAQVPAAPAAEPPAVVGSLGQSSGTVWVSPGSGQPWQAALANQPLTGGEAIATAPNGHATIDVMAMRAALGPGSELALDQLDAQGLSATVTSGEVALDLTGLPQGANVAIATPRGTVEITTPGRYAITAGDTSTPTTVTALDGGASIVNGPATEEVRPGQTATLTTETNGSVAFVAAPAQPDPLLRTLIAAAPPPSAVPPPPEVAAMTGGDNLSAYGNWATLPTYGTVWFPNVGVDWVPYRDGRWIYAAPWGWTWVDADPWGFAPFHYGRWVQVGPRWAWAPVAPGIQVSVGVPIYAPALVNFFAVGSIGGVGVSVSAGALAAGLVGWVPLGPGEIYRPPYAVSPTYIRQINVYNVRNINTINVTRVTNNITINNFRNHAAMTTVPAAVLREGRPVGRAFVRPAPENLAAWRPLAADPPLRPAPHPTWAEPPRGVAAPAVFHGSPAHQPATAFHDVPHAPAPQVAMPVNHPPPPGFAAPELPRPASGPQPAAASHDVPHAPAPQVAMPVNHPPPPGFAAPEPPRPASGPQPAAASREVPHPTAPQVVMPVNHPPPPGFAAPELPRPASGPQPAAASHEVPHPPAPQVAMPANHPPPPGFAAPEPPRPASAPQPAAASHQVPHPPAPQVAIPANHPAPPRYAAPEPPRPTQAPQHRPSEPQQSDAQHSAVSHPAPQPPRRVVEQSARPRPAAPPHAAPAPQPPRRVVQHSSPPRPAPPSHAAAAPQRGHAEDRQRG